MLATLPQPHLYFFPLLIEMPEVVCRLTAPMDARDIVGQQQGRRISQKIKMDPILVLTRKNMSKFSRNVYTPPMCVDRLLPMVSTQDWWKSLVVWRRVIETVVGCWIAPKRNKRRNRPSDFTQSIRVVRAAATPPWNLKSWIQADIKGKTCSIFLRGIRHCRCWHRNHNTSIQLKALCLKYKHKEK